MNKTVTIPVRVPMQGTFVMVDVEATLTYSSEDREGEDIDGNRGKHTTFLEDVSIERVTCEGEDVTDMFKHGLSDWLQDRVNELTGDVVANDLLDLM